MAQRTGGSAPSRSRRLRALARAAQMLIGLSLVSSAAYASVTLSYSTASTQSLTLKNPPIIWSAGPDSSGNPFIASWALSANKTYFTVNMKPVPEANVTWGNLTTLNNQDTVTYNVTVTGTSVLSNAKVLDFRMEFRNYGTDALIGALNFRDASPSLTLSNVPASGNYYVKTYMKLDTDTNAADLPASVTVSLSVAP